ncbi:MAG TPA: anthranilate synthase component I family protein [Cytophagaceae bacterium]|jgi:para-aminobenzoate synthetase component 1|nr:anthranilate synthase component I family protein [Cytophagaceae bacterium]
MTTQPILSSHQLLAYAAAHFDTYCYLNGNNIVYPHEAFPRLMGIGIKEEYIVYTEAGFSWSAMDRFINAHCGEYIFLCINYRLKNKIEHFSSSLYDPLEFPLIHLYCPQYIFEEKNQHWEAANKEAESLSYTILAGISESTVQTNPTKASSPAAQFSHEQYIHIVHKIKEELAKGNIYEINFCNSYSGTYSDVDYLSLYEKLNHISPMPFSVLYKNKQHVLLSASPERFVQKRHNTLVSQPIKGTAGRKENSKEDELQKKALEQSLKERTENIMIVDLVRNDLSKICTGGSVQVEELCKVYTFERVHQLISTIKGELEQPDISFSEIIKALFPMGSMTGAPKLRAMRLIDELEKEDRGLFSGSAGYIAPNGDFDFNVIIRSLLFNENKGLYKFHAGSAITIASDAELEYQECEVKTLPIRLLLKNLL